MKRPIQHVFVGSGAVSRAAREIDAAIRGRQYVAFGCPVRGLHTADSDEASCTRCQWDRGNLDGGVSMPFTDDRGPSFPLRDGETSWPHTRWVDRLGRLHRSVADGPAVEGGGWRIWAEHGVVGRTEGPAVERDGDWAHLEDGVLHRGGDLPAVCWHGGAFEHWIHGRLTRDRGPALYRGQWAEYILDGASLTRDALFGRWCETHAGVHRDNSDAIAVIAGAMLNGNALNPFPDLDALLPEVVLALTLHPNPEQVGT